MKSKEKSIVNHQELTKLEVSPLDGEATISMDSISAIIFVNNKTGADYEINEHYVGMFVRQSK